MKVRTECHSGWIPFWRKRRSDGQPRKRRMEEEKDGGRGEKTQLESGKEGGAFPW